MKKNGSAAINFLRNIPCGSIAIILFLFFISSKEFYSQTNILECERISSNDGLSENTIHSITQDRNGYLWIGTSDGLNQYDGYTFREFRKRSNKSHSLTSSTIRAVCQLKSNNQNAIWVGTDNGLNRINTTNGSVKQYRNVNSEQQNFILGGISCLYEDAKGFLWIGTNNGLFRMDTKTEIFNRYLTVNKHVGKLNYTFILSILEMPFGSGVIWVGTDKGIYQFNMNTNRITNVVDKNIFKIQPKLGKIYSLESFKDSLLFIGTSRGLLIYDYTKKTTRYYPQMVSSHYKENMIRSLHISPYKPSVAWIGTETSLLSYDLESKNFNRVNLRCSDLSNTANLTVQSIFEDEFGIIWLGTYSHGLLKLNTRKIIFNRVKPALNFSVWSLKQSEDSNWWIGTSNGLYKLERDNKLEYIGNGINKGSNSEKFQIRAIVEDFNLQEKILWLGLLGGGISKYNVETGQTTNYKIKIGMDNPKEENNVYVLFIDRKGNMWVGTNGGGLYKFNKKTGEAKCYPFISEIGTKHRWITSICEDDDGKLWIATFMGGLAKFDPEKNKFDYYRVDDEKDNGLNSNCILSLHLDTKGYLWIASYGGGLAKLNIKEGIFTHYTTEDGLANDVIYSILEDELGNLWLSTNKGISKFNPCTESFINYSVKDGMQGNEFNLGAYYKSNDGKLYFGGNDGITTFYPYTSFNNIPPRICFTKIKTNDKEITISHGIEECSEFEFGYQENSLNISFVGIHFGNSLKNQYKYMLVGVDKNWNYSPDQRSVSYASLKPGCYLFKLNSANSDGIWNNNERTLTITILQPFWKTWWFIALALLLIFGFFFFLYRLRIKYVCDIEKSRYEEREAVRKKISEDFHDEVGHKSTQIMLLVDLLKKETQLLPELSLKKLNLISDYSKILYNEMRNLSWELDPEKDTLYHLVVSLKSFSDHLFDNTNIAFELEGDLASFENLKLSLVLRQNLLRIFKEGMHNILKHSKSCKNVVLRIIYENSILIIQLKDDGCGFDTSNNGIGNGLSNMKKRAERINAKLAIASESGQGTIITIETKLS